MEFLNGFGFRAMRKPYTYPAQEAASPALALHGTLLAQVWMGEAHSHKAGKPNSRAREGRLCRRYFLTLFKKIVGCWLVCVPRTPLLQCQSELSSDSLWRRGPAQGFFWIHLSLLTLTWSVSDHTQLVPGNLQTCYSVLRSNSGHSC